MILLTHLLRTRLLTAVFILTLHSLVVVVLEGAPRVPRSDSEILEQVPIRSGVNATRGIRGWAQLRDQDALKLAQDWMKEWETSRDPRVLGRVQAVLRRWWLLDNPPAEVRLIRARVRQHGHDFGGAIADLDWLVQNAAPTPEMFAMLSSIQLVCGEVQQARASALQMARKYPGLWAAATAAAVAANTGQLDEAKQLLYRNLRQHGSEDRVLRAWCWGLLGELTSQKGESDEALHFFKTAVDLDPHQGYLKVAMADQLLELGRFEEAWEVLQSFQGLETDALLVRKAIVLQRLGRDGQEFQRIVDALKSGFEGARLRGLSKHLREEAMLEWQVLGRVDRAYELARENWQKQKEVPDARLLVRTALAAGRKAGIEEIRSWVKNTGLEDVHLADALKTTDAGGVRAEVYDRRP